jgi:uncharacterized repeat protein (TIGR03899 family)
LILAEADAERQSLLRRAAHRLAIQEVRRQEYIESIINQAVKNLPATVSSDPVDPDWISRFFDECKDVSNEDLQKIWARILANEVTSPGSCSRKTLSTLKDLSAKDADLFNRIGNLLWLSNGDIFLPHRIDISFNEEFKKYRLDYDALLHLNSLGLIHCSPELVYEINYKDSISYFGNKSICFITPVNRLINIYIFPLTNSGKELFLSINKEIDLVYYTESIMMFSKYYNIYLASPLNYH